MEQNNSNITERVDSFEDLYMNTMQIKATVIDSNILIAEVARGAGKTEGIFGPRMVRVGTDMPGELSFLAHKTYTALLSNIIPNILSFFSKIGMEEGKHFIIGEKNLPKHFSKPNYPIAYPKHSLVLYTGHNFQLVSTDQPESIAGRSGVHVFAEELKHSAGEKIKTRIFPGLRGGTGKTRLSAYYGGITGVSDTARVDLGEDDWFQEYEGNVDESLLADIVSTALYVNGSKLRSKKFQDQLKNEKDPEKRRKLKLKIQTEARKNAYYSPILAQQRQLSTYYIKASTFVNKDILGTKYFKMLLDTMDEHEFLAAICNIRPNRVTDMFFGGFDKKIHTFDDSYIYNSMLQLDLRDTFTLTAQYLKHYDPKLPLLIGYDPGHFTSIAIAQEKKNDNELRVIKTFHCVHPKAQDELARLVWSFFGPYQQNKKIILYADRAGNQSKLMRDKITTDSRMLKKELESYNFRVDLKTEKQRTIYYYEHYNLLRILLSEQMKFTTRIRIDSNECSNLVSAIHLTPVKREDGKIEMDKTSERKVALQYQAALTPQIPSALTYLIFGLFANQLPGEMKRGTPIPPSMTS